MPRKAAQPPTPPVRQAVVPARQPDPPRVVYVQRMSGGRFGALSEPSENDKYQLRIGSGLTPQFISAILRRADTGDMVSIADMLDEVRETDPHLHAVLFKRETQVAGAQWELRPHRRARKSKKRDKVIDFCTDVLTNLQGFSQVCAHLQSAIYHGRAAAENLWVRDGSRLIIEKINPIHPRRLSYAANNWKLHLWDSTGGTVFSGFPGVPFDSFPKGKFITHTPRVRGGYPTREGLGRVLVWYSVFKRWTQRDWMALAEMVGRPGRVGYYGTGKADLAKDGMPEASDADIALLQSALEDWCSSVSVSLPDTVKMAFQNTVSGYGDLHKVLSDHCNSEMSKAALGETLTTESGSRGARSLGDVHDDIRLMIAMWDAKCLSETLRYFVLAPLVRFNFGDNTPVPEFVFSVEPNENMNMKAERYSKLASAGLDIDQDHVRDEFGIPEPLEGSTLLIPRSSIPGNTPSLIVGQVQPPVTPTDPTKPPAAEPTSPQGNPQDSGMAGGMDNMNSGDMMNE